VLAAVILEKKLKSKFINARKAAMEKIQTLQMFQKVIMEGGLIGKMY